MPALIHWFCFADLNNGIIFYTDIADIKKGQRSPISELQLSMNGSTVTLAQLAGITGMEMCLGEDSKGELYIITNPDGKLYKIKVMYK